MTEINKRLYDLEKAVLPADQPGPLGGQRHRGIALLLDRPQSLLFHNLEDLARRVLEVWASQALGATIARPWWRTPSARRAS